MGENRLDRLCMLSVHRQKVNNFKKFVEKVVEQFGLKKTQFSIYVLKSYFCSHIKYIFA